MTNVEILINTEFNKKRYKAPKKKCMFPFAIPKPVVQMGGINAVAIAIPGNTLLASFLLTAIIPASPPNIAIKASKKVGCIHASNSD